ncbi:Hypothetical predicted protein, partial [Paramuricea clavata]
MQATDKDKVMLSWLLSKDDEPQVRFPSWPGMFFKRKSAFKIVVHNLYGPMSTNLLNKAHQLEDFYRNQRVRSRKFSDNEDNLRILFMNYLR